MPIYNAPLTAIDRRETLRYAGLAKKNSFAPELVETALEEALLLVMPQSVWEIYNYNADAQKILAAHPLRLTGEKIGGHLAACEKIVVLCATVGEDIERAVTEHFARGEYTLAVLLDAAATAAVEQTADATEEIIGQTAKKRGLKMRTRFSPGYGDWPLTEQRSILPLAGGDKIGVTLTESLMLMPRKSITAVIGLSREPQGIAPVTRCAACNKTDCPSRQNITQTQNP